MTGCRLLGHRTEKSDMIQLRSTVARDLPDLLGWVGSEAGMILWSGPTFSWPLDLEQLDTYLAESPAASRLVWTAFDHVEPAPVGHFGLALQGNGDTGRLGRVLVAPNARHLGYGRAVTQAALTAGFNETTTEVMKLGVYRHNSIGRRLYEQLGFKTALIVENSVTIDGEPWDNIEMRLPRHLS